MCLEELTVVLFCLLFSVERSNAIRSVQHGVRVPLLHTPEEECVAKTISFCFAVGRAAVISFWGGRSTHEKSRQQSRDYDATMGFPGEDICS